MKSLITEKNKMGQEEEPELLVKGKARTHNCCSACYGQIAFKQELYIF